MLSKRIVNSLKFGAPYNPTLKCGIPRLLGTISNKPTIYNILKLCFPYVDLEFIEETEFMTTVTMDFIDTIITIYINFMPMVENDRKDVDLDCSFSKSLPIYKVENIE